MKKRIWHKQDEIPELGRCVLIIQCFGKNDINVEMMNTESMFDINLEKLYGKDYHKFMQALKIITWAYIEDLVDEETDKFVKKEVAENFEKYFKDGREIGREWDEFVEKGGLEK